MGERRSGLSLLVIYWDHRMRFVLLIIVLLAIIEVESAKKKAKPRPKPKCPVGKYKKSTFTRFTETRKVVRGKGKNRKVINIPIADQPCWWDLNRSDCGKCKSNGQQCGYPMHKWCQSKASKQGCKGIPHFATTLSTKGYPCYWNMGSKDCAWCTRIGTQCKPSGLSNRCGNYCLKAAVAQCDGIPTQCNRIATCGLGATCNRANGACKCNTGYVGNGLQCFNRTTGTPAVDPNTLVEMEINMNTEFEVYPHQSHQFSMPVNLVASNTGELIL